MIVPFLDLKRQYEQIGHELQPMLTEAMTNGAFIGGPNVTGFEEAFAGFCETRHCIGVGSGTDALRFALMAVGVSSGDRVITVPNTFIATTEAISQVGAKPVFIDVQEGTYNIDPQKLEEYLNKRLKVHGAQPAAIIPVHLYGQPADMQSLLKIAQKYRIAVVEDACQAHGALYRDKKVGSIGSAGCFSFYPGKNLGAFGEAGAVVTGDEKIAQKIRMIRDHGQKEKYVHEIEGYNGRMDAIQAGVLRVKLTKLQEWNLSRRKHAALYRELLSGIPGIVLPTEPDFAFSVYHLFVILLDDRDGLREFLQKKGIATGLHYPLPLHLQKAYAHLGYQPGSFPVAESAARRLLSLPMFPELKREQIEYVCDSIKEYVERRTS